MAKMFVQSESLSAIADAIRGKTGKTDALTLEQMPGEIEGIQSESGDELATILLTRPEIDTFIVPDNITELGFGSLQTWTGLKNVVLPKVETLGGSSFYKCSDLISVYAPLMKTVNSQAFYGCTALTDITAPELSILNGSNIFENCKALTIVDFPKLSKIVNRTFLGCSNLSVLILRNTELCAFAGVNSFANTPFASDGTGGTVYVPQALIEEYQNATNWSTLYAAGTCNFVAIEGSEYE